MRRIKHIIFWLVVIGLVLLLFSSHVIAENIHQKQQCIDLIHIITGT